MVTLNLTNNQAIMLHAIFGNLAPEDIIDMVNGNLNNYIKNGEEDTYYFTAYRALKHFINAHPTKDPFGEQDVDLFDELDWIVEGIGRKLNRKILESSNESKETNK